MDELAKRRTALGRRVLATASEEVGITRLDGSVELFDLPISYEEEAKAAWSVGGVPVVPYYDLDALPDAKTIESVKTSMFTLNLTYPE